MKYNKSEIFKRAWSMVKEMAITMSEALKRAWAEAKDTVGALVEYLKKNLEEMTYNHYHISLGMERKVSVKKWEKNGSKRMYLNIDCYTLAGNYKGQYKCGYVDMVSGNYVVGKYDDVNAEKKEYIGR